ncbi:hypothetical protein BGZ99_002824 [Dissophora globulifera]|uniref:Creatinase/aminopeptidase n=1 Tax=Dissophora globulifera TaxID=979702 RepID=A0A9P6V066_9FUNG|nr:hypothetical protein BGZ99_002824 [Dissophora globulifera]
MLLRPSATGFPQLARHAAPLIHPTLRLTSLSRSVHSLRSANQPHTHRLLSPIRALGCLPRTPFAQNVRWISSVPAATNTTDRVQQLRELMKRPDYNVSAFVIPSEDAHQSEYVAECDERRAYISGFTGSAGLAIVSLDSAALFTDGRYYLQASQQLDSNWTLMKSGLPNVPSWQEYLVKLPIISTKTLADANNLEKVLAKIGSTLVPVPNLVDRIWKDRPSRPAHPLRTLSTATTGRTHTAKIEQLRKDLAAKGATGGCVVSGLDEIAWLFNMRGSDVHCNPVFFAYAIVTQDYVRLYLQKEVVTDEVRAHLGSEVDIRPYENVYADLKGLSERATKENQKVLLGTRTNLALAVALGKENVVEARSPVTDAKAVKNETELEGMRQCHLRDAVAVVNYFAWLENQLNKGTRLDEVDAADRLQQFRSEQKGYVGPSFDTISSTGPNGAIIHYSPQKATASIIDPKQVYLCDSGAQYLDGTTDITRTMHFGEPTVHEKRCFTRVLQGHIAIDSIIFPDGTTGYVLDILSRRALWSDGLDFRHGTGHGVGAFLNVHEGPHGCGARPAYNEVALKPGMTLTNEPGYYEDGKFGIRIENVLLLRKVETKHRFGGKEFYGFEHITFVPIQTKMIDRQLLSETEVNWINRYHEECLEKVAPRLEKDSLAYNWLLRQTAPL